LTFIEKVYTIYIVVLFYFVKQKIMNWKKL